MKSISPFSIAGEIEAIKTKRSGEVAERRKFHNLVLESGLAELFRRWCSTGMSAGNTSQDLVRYLYLGTGTSEPATSDIGLESRSGTLAGKNGGTAPYASGNVIDFDNDYYEVWYTYRYAYSEGEAEGVWTELGLSDSSYANPMTRALFRGESGNAESLTVLSDEYLTVFYTIRFVMEPQDLGEIQIGGETISCRYLPGVNTYENSDGSVFYNYATGHLTREDTGMLSNLQPLLNVSDGTTTTADVVNNWSFSSDTYVSQGISYSDSVSAEAADFMAQLNLQIEPTDNDVPLAAIAMLYGHFQFNSGRGEFGVIRMDPVANKRADYRVTIAIDIELVAHGEPVSGLTDTATTTSLDFTWDAYPNATEYRLVLRQAGTEITTQTVTAPTTTASFSGLTASTQYHLDIKPIATPRNGRRLIYAASTTA